LPESGVVLAQIAVESKENEIVAATKVLTELNLRGMGQREWVTLPPRCDLSGRPFPIEARTSTRSKRHSEQFGSGVTTTKRLQECG
jgi:hypothetical protein